MHTWPIRGAVLAAICALPAWGQAENVIETTYKSLEAIPGSDRRILHTGDRQTYQVTDRVYQANRALFYTIKRDDPIRIEVGAGSQLVTIEKRSADDDEPTAGVDTRADGFRQQFQALSRGDVVEVNGSIYRLLSAGDAEVTLSLRVPNSDPPRYSGSSRIAYDQIRFVNVIEAKQTDGPVEDDSGVNDLLTREGIATGDTVLVRMLPGAGPGAVQGRVGGMSRSTLRLAIWRGAGYDRMLDLSREDIRAVERTELKGRRNVPLGSLTIAWQESRYVERRASRSDFKVVLQHDEPGKVLVGLWIRPLNADGEPAASGGAAVRPMFPGMPRAVQLGSASLEATLGFSQEGLSEIDSSGPEAEVLLVEALADAASDETLRALLLAATQSGSKRLLAYAGARAVTDPPDSAGATLAREALAKVSDQAARWADDLLAREDDQIRLLQIQDFELKPTALPRGIRPLEFRGRLIALYADLDRALNPSRAARLFEQALRDTSLVDPLATTFAAEPGVAFPVLLEVYLDPDLTQDRKQLARDVIVAMGADGVDALSAELVGRGIDARPLAAAVEKRQPLVDQVELGLRLARLQAVEGEVAEARALLAKEELEAAFAKLRPVLAQFPRHPAGNALLDDLRLPLARLYLSTRRRSDAMRLLTDAQGSEAKTRLAALYLEAATEELTGVVVRDEPHVAAQNIGLLDKGQSLPGRRVDADWVEVSFSAERKGYIRSVCVDSAGQTFTVRVIYLPVPAFEELLEHAKTLAPTLAPQCETLLGRRYLQQAVQTYEDGDYGLSLTLFAKAREHIDEDERLSLERIAWFYAYWWLFAGIGGLLVISVGVYFLANYLRRKRKIELTKSAPLEIKTESGRIVRPTKREAPQAGKPRWTSPVFLLQVALALALGGVILYQGWKLARAF